MSFSFKFRFSINDSASKAFQDGRIDAKIHADTAIDDVSIQVSEVAASDSGERPNKGDNVADPAGDTGVIEFQAVLFYFGLRV